MADPADFIPLGSARRPAGGTERPEPGQRMGKHRSRAGGHTGSAGHPAGRTACRVSKAGEAAKGNRQAGKDGLGGETTETEDGFVSTYSKNKERGG